MRGLPRKRGTVRSFGVLLAAVTCAAMLPVSVAGGVGATGALEFDSPSGLAFGGGHLWVTNEMGNSVTEIDPSSGAWIATFNAKIYGFRRPTSITRFGPYLFVANSVGTVSELRASNGAFIRTISGARYHFVNPVAIEAAGSLILVLNAGGRTAGSITEIRARSGSLVRTVSGSRFAFSDPVAFAVSGANVFVTDKGNNSVTAVRITTGGLVWVVAQQGLSAPDGIAVVGGNAWVADSASSSATEIATTTGTVITTKTDADGAYGFGTPSMVIARAATCTWPVPCGAVPW